MRFRKRETTDKSGNRQILFVIGCRHFTRIAEKSAYDGSGFSSAFDTRRCAEWDWQHARILGAVETWLRSRGVVL